MVNNTPTNSQPEQTVAALIAELGLARTPKMFKEAQAAVNRQALATALRLIGDDEVINHEFDHVGNIKKISEEYYTVAMIPRNQLRQELRQAFTDYYGGGE